jgi:alanyl-tRNA synthetase
MTLPKTDTIVTYPAGHVTSNGKVVHVQPLDDDRRAVILDVTAAHPVDSVWPDQSSDRAALVVGGTSIAIEECIVGATDGAALYSGTDIPVKKGADGWAFLVVHVIDSDAPVEEGDAAEVQVDATYRRDLSAGHSACHLASLALNAALAGAWTKPVPVDGAGNPNFDALAIQTSTILENGSRDEYRIGKSLRKKGFSVAALSEAAVQDEVNRLLREWVSAGGPIRIAREGDGLTDRRFWQCDIEGNPVSIPCGGTHATDLTELDGVSVSLVAAEGDGALALTMNTTCRGPQS